MISEQQIRDMVPGRELDELVAEKVMGWSWGMIGDLIPAYSTDISAAWDVLRKMNELEYWVTIAESAKTAGESVFDVTFEKAEIKWAVNDYFCKAVCKCALIAILRGGSGE